jgi:hypothetical protein
MKDGFYGAWFPAIVLKTFLEKCLVRYDEYLNEDDNSKHLCGMVQISQLTLVPPNINNMHYYKCWCSSLVPIHKTSEFITFPTSLCLLRPMNSFKI